MPCTHTSPDAAPSQASATHRHQEALPVLLCSCSILISRPPPSDPTRRRIRQCSNSPAPQPSPLTPRRHCHHTLQTYLITCKPLQASATHRQQEAPARTALLVQHPHPTTTTQRPHVASPQTTQPQPCPPAQPSHTQTARPPHMPHTPRTAAPATPAWRAASRQGSRRV